ncbi:AIR synthase family protein [Chloroflexota bacterium]
MGTGTLDVGKLPMGLLKDLLERYGGTDERLVVGPRIGEDAAVLDLGSRYLVLKSDPVTFATEDIGWYVVQVNANDIAAMGATPQWLLLTLLLPEKRTDRALVETIFSQASAACQELGIVLCGGHTEITYGLDRPIAVGMLVGEVDKDDLVCTAGAQVGDDLLLTKGIAIEGTAILAKELGDQLLGKLDPQVIACARQLLKEPGISVLRDAQTIRAAGRVHAMHDPTEGGLATGLWELAQASEKGLLVDLAKIPLLPETVVFCEELGLDPLGLIASGALLASVAPQDSGRMLSALEEKGIGASIIGQVVGGPADVMVTEADVSSRLPTFSRDELARVLEERV